MYAKMKSNLLHLMDGAEEGAKPVTAFADGKIYPNALVETPEAWVHDSDLKAILDAEKVKQDRKIKRLRWMEFGKDMLADIVEMNSAKIASGTLTTAQIRAMARDADLVEIKDLLILGDLQGAKAVITAYNGIYYTASEKTDLVAKLAQKIAGG